VRGSFSFKGSRNTFKDLSDTNIWAIWTTQGAGAKIGVEDGVGGGIRPILSQLRMTIRFKATAHKDSHSDPYGPCSRQPNEVDLQSRLIELNVLRGLALNELETGLDGDDELFGIVGQADAGSDSRVILFRSRVLSRS
jgi:hypothetical protein